MECCFRVAGKPISYRPASSGRRLCDDQLRPREASAASARRSAGSWSTSSSTSTGDGRRRRRRRRRPGAEGGGDRGHPMSQGYTCAKGAPCRHAHPPSGRSCARLLQDAPPGARAAGALDAQCRGSAASVTSPPGWREILQRHGQRSVGIFFGSGLGMDFQPATDGRGAAQSRIGTQPGSAATIDGHGEDGDPRPGRRVPGPQAGPGLRGLPAAGLPRVNPVVSHGHTTRS